MEEPSPVKSRLRPFRLPPLSLHWLRFVIPLVITILALRFFWVQLDRIERGWDTVRGMEPWIIGLALAAEVISYSGSGYLLRSMARMLGDDLSIRRGMTLTLAGNSVGLVAGGTLGSSALIYKWLRASGTGSETAALGGALPVVFLNFFYLVLSIAGVIQLFVIHKLTVLQAVAFGLTLATLIVTMAVVLWGVSHPDWLKARLDRLARRWTRWRGAPYDPSAVEDRVNRMVDTWVLLVNGGWRGPALGTAVNVLFDMLAMVLVFYAAGQTLTVPLALAGYGLPMLIGRLPGVPGGIGVTEAMMIAVFVSLGVPRQTAVIGTLGFRLISFWGPSLTGFLLAAYLQRVTRAQETQSA